ncbi:MAG TPA: hypothetical protein VK335_26040 [Bryobacteraceae bacterium]|nr:hypothetical protein [Bryobacteraceae bacterium]
MLLHPAQIAAIPNNHWTFHAFAADKAIADVNGVTSAAGRTSAQGGVVLG